MLSLSLTLFLSLFKLANGIQWGKNWVRQCVMLNKGIMCIVERSVVNVPEQTCDLVKCTSMISNWPTTIGLIYSFAGPSEEVNTAILCLDEKRAPSQVLFSSIFPLALKPFLMACGEEERDSG